MHPNPSPAAAWHGRGGDRPRGILKKVYPEGFVWLEAAAGPPGAPGVGKSVFFGGELGELRWWRRAAKAAARRWRWLMVVVCRRSLPQITPEGALPAELGASVEAENGGLRVHC